MVLDKWITKSFSEWIKMIAAFWSKNGSEVFLDDCFLSIFLKWKKEWNDFQVEFDSAGTQTDFSLENLGLNLIQRWYLLFWLHCFGELPTLFYKMGPKGKFIIFSVRKVIRIRSFHSKSKLFKACRSYIDSFDVIHIAYAHFLMTNTKIVDWIKKKN